MYNGLLEIIFKKQEWIFPINDWHVTIISNMFQITTKLINNNKKNDMNQYKQKNGSNKCLDYKVQNSFASRKVYLIVFKQMQE